MVIKDSRAELQNRTMNKIIGILKYIWHYINIFDIPRLTREIKGMTVYVKENKTKYILENGIENVNWKVDSSGGGSGGDVDLSDYYTKQDTTLF